MNERNAQRISKCDLFLLVPDVNVREIEKLENIIQVLGLLTLT